MGRWMLWACLLAMTLASSGGAQSVDSLLRVGDAFPQLGGTAISGRRIDVPVPGRRTVVIMGFSRAGGDDSRRWDESIAADSSRADVVVVAELQSVPRLLRGTVTLMIKRGVPAGLRDRMLLLSRDEAAWKRRLGVTSDEHAYVTLIDTSGRVRWMSRGASDSASVQALRAELADPLRSR